MVFIVWLVLAAAISSVAVWGLRRTSGATRTLNARSWQVLAVQVASLAVAGAATWWLLDVPGILRTNEAVRTGDAAAILANPAHPIIQPDGTWIIVLMVVGMLALGSYGILRPVRFLSKPGQDVPSGAAGESMARRGRVYGVIFVALGLLSGVGFAVLFLLYR